MGPKRLGWVGRQSFGALLAASRSVRDVDVHVRPIDGHAGTLSQLSGALMHLDQVSKNGCAEAFRDDNTGSNNNHVVGFVDGQPITNTPVGPEGRLEVALLVGEAG